MNLPQAAEPSPYSPLAVCLYLSSGSIRQTDAGGYWSRSQAVCLSRCLATADRQALPSPTQLRGCGSGGKETFPPPNATASVLRSWRPFRRDGAGDEPAASGRTLALQPLAVCLYLSSGSIRQTDAGGYWSRSQAVCLSRCLATADRQALPSPTQLCYNMRWKGSYRATLILAIARAVAGRVDRAAAGCREGVALRKYCSCACT